MIRSLAAALALLVAAPVAALGPFSATIKPSWSSHDTTYSGSCSSPANAYDSSSEGTYSQCSGSYSGGVMYGTSTVWSFALADIQAAIPDNATVTSSVWYVHYINVGNADPQRVMACALEWGGVRTVIGWFDNTTMLTWSSSAWRDATVTWGPNAATLRSSIFNVFCKYGNHDLVNPGYMRIGHISLVVWYTIPDPPLGTIFFTN